MSETRELQIKIAFLEGALLDLNDVVRGLADEVVELSKQVRELERQLAPQDDPSQVQEPPHYGRL